MENSKFQFINPYLVEMHNSFKIQVKKSTNDNRANVELTLLTNEGNNEAPFQIRAKVASDFKWEDGIEEKSVEALLNMNAPALLLSYLRLIVANITNASKYPAYNLPFINFRK